MITRAMVALVRKDLYLYRWLIVGTLVGGMLALWLSGLDGNVSLAGHILLVTAIVVLGVILAVHGPLSERQAQSYSFVLSLPVSIGQAAAARVLGSLSGFLLAWAPLLLVVLTLHDGPSGELAWFVGLMVFLLANFGLLLALTVLGRNELWSVTGIVVSNTAVPLFQLLALPALTRGADGELAWTPQLFLTLSGLLLAAALALGLALLFTSRRDVS